MTDRDFLLCALHLILDDEERLDALCPSCRAKAEEPHCPICGCLTASDSSSLNSSFDSDRFEKLKRGELP